MLSTEVHFTIDIEEVAAVVEEVAEVVDCRLWQKICGIFDSIPTSFSVFETVQRDHSFRLLITCHPCS